MRRHLNEAYQFFLLLSLGKFEPLPTPWKRTKTESWCGNFQYIYICICNTNEYPEVHWGGSKLGIYTTFPRTCFERDYKERQTYAERPFPVSVLHIKRMLG